jgi:hypothetical protein
MAIDDDGPDEAPDEIDRRYYDEIKAYMETQPASYRALRDTGIGGEAWPSNTNPMLRYLVDRTVDYIENKGLPLDEAIFWLAAHAWFEGHLDGREWGAMSAG